MVSILHLSLFLHLLFENVLRCCRSIFNVCIKIVKKKKVSGEDLKLGIN